MVSFFLFPVEGVWGFPRRLQALRAEELTSVLFVKAQKNLTFLLG